jgi:polyvinyl alcohol dehydrogenase (cytochrome)
MAADTAGFCKSHAPTLAIEEGDWNGWGNDPSNSRQQRDPGFAANDVGRLKLKWAFGFAGQSVAFAHPTFAGGRIFIGSAAGAVYSIDAATGCIHWVYRADAAVRTAILITKLPAGKWAAFFGDRRGNAYAIDAETAEFLWKIRVDEHRGARITGSPVLAGGRLYVPMSSDEESLAQTPEYRCCTFRGSVTALDPSTGRIVWKCPVVDGPSKPYSLSASGTEMVGPAGAGIWSAPTIDIKRQVLYVTTGNSYTGVDLGTSDAIVAVDLDSGKLVWSRQTHARDNFIAGCPYHPNCPPGNGDDFDYGSSAVLRTLPDGSEILVAGEKSGVVYGLDPDHQGKILWQTRVGEGGSLGGIQWGLAADEGLVYAAVSDRLLGRFNRAGLYALKLATGELKWSAPAPAAPGNPAQSAAVSTMPGLVFSGSVNGHFRAYSIASGAIVWDYDTKRAFDTVNGVEGHGGSIDGPGPVIAHGMVFTNSGYVSFGGTAGNVLLAFSIDGK